MVAAIIGSTGLTGSFLVRLILREPSISKLISISRSSLHIADSKLEEILVSDLAELPSLTPKIQADFYFCCLGTTIKIAGSKENFLKVDHEAVLAFARIAKTQNAKSFSLISAMGASAQSMFFYPKVKGRTEDEVSSLGLSSLTIYRPSLLVGPRKETRITEEFAVKILVPLGKILPDRLTKTLVTQVETLSKRMLSEALIARQGIQVISANAI